MDEDDIDLPLQARDLEDMRRMALIRMRRPAHFRPWENVRPDGHRLQDAILELTLPSCRWTVQHLLADEEIGLYERSKVFRDHLWQNLWWRLQQGQLFMRGLDLATGAEWRSEPRMFDDAEPDFNLNRITCFGRTFASIRVYESPATSDTLHPPVGEPASGMERAAAWMRENVTQYVANQRDDRVAECISAIRVKKDDAKAGWMALPEAIRGKSRQPK